MSINRTDRNKLALIKEYKKFERVCKEIREKAKKCNIDLSNIPIVLEPKEGGIRK